MIVALIRNEAADLWCFLAVCSESHLGTDLVHYWDYYFSMGHGRKNVLQHAFWGKTPPTFKFALRLRKTHVYIYIYIYMYKVYKPYAMLCSRYGDMYACMYACTYVCYACMLRVYVYRKPVNQSPHVNCLTSAWSLHVKGGGVEFPNLISPCKLLDLCLIPPCKGRVRSIDMTPPIPSVL